MRPQPPAPPPPPTEPEQNEAPASDDGGTEGSSLSEPVTAIDPGLAGRSVIRTASLTIQATDVTAAGTNAAAAARAQGGFVAAQNASSDPLHPRQATVTMTLRVPVANYDALLAALSGLGRVIASNQATDDVTDEVVDVASRVATQRAGVDQVRALLDRAETLGQVIQLENELTRRQADLESLLARQAKLADLTALATVQLDIRAPRVAPTPTPVVAAEKPPERGFFAGLSNGWDAFATLAVGVATVVGALLPFVLIIGVPVLVVWLVWRRRQRLVEAGPLATLD